MKMRKSETAFLILIVFLMLSCLPSPAFSASYSISYELLNQPGGSTYYRLNVAISESLLDYYSEGSHVLISENDFAKFVTPYTLRPIAGCLREIYLNDEDFANGVLMIVHQIPYLATGPPKYPVETMEANSGDCELFSYVAASIMKSGGLNVVLFYYPNEDHMNIGVALSNPPQMARGGVDYLQYNGTRYYMAECTGGNWQNGWRVGECPDELRNATVEIVPLENSEVSAPEQVSASYNALTASSTSLGVSSSFLIEGNELRLSGTLLPSQQNVTITLYVKANGLPWSKLSTVSTDVNGRFEYVWVTNVSGLCYLRASWSGNEDYATSDSATRMVTIFPWFFIALAVIIAVLVSAGVFEFFVSRHNRLDVSVPQPPDPPF